MAHRTARIVGCEVQRVLGDRRDAAEMGERWAAWLGVGGGFPSLSRRRAGPGRGTPRSACWSAASKPALLAFTAKPGGFVGKVVPCVRQLCHGPRGCHYGVEFTSKRQSGGAVIDVQSGARGWLEVARENPRQADEMVQNCRLQTPGAHVLRGWPPDHQPEAATAGESILASWVKPFGRAGTGLMYSVVGTLMLTPAPLRRSPAPARIASATGRAGASSLSWCAASPASRFCGPATPAMAPPGSRGPNVEPDILSSAPAASHGRDGVASTKVSISTVGQKNRILSLSDDDGRAAAYWPDR